MSQFLILISPLKSVFLSKYAVEEQILKSLSFVLILDA